MRTIRIAALIVVLGVATSSAAAPVTWVFEGEVRLINDASAATLDALSSVGVFPGSSFSGQLVFESTTPDVDADPDLGRYNGAVILYEVTLGSLHVEFGAGAEYNQMVVNAADGVLTALGYESGTSSLFASPILELVLNAGPGGSISSEDLPLIPPDLASLLPFQIGEATGYGTGILVYGSEGNIMGELTSLEVPEASVFLVLLAPLALAAGCRRSSAST